MGHAPEQKLNRLKAIKGPYLLPDDVNSPQSLLLKNMLEKYEKLQDEVLGEASFCLVKIRQNETSTKELQELLEDITCLIQRSAAAPQDLYSLLEKYYRKDTKSLGRLLQECGFLEVRPEHLGLFLRKYAYKNKISPTDFVAIGEYAKNDASLSQEEKKSMRDIINFMKHPISRRTFECFCVSRSEVFGIELSPLQKETLMDTMNAAQNELRLPLENQKCDVIEVGDLRNNL